MTPLLSVCDTYAWARAIRRQAMYSRGNIGTKSSVDGLAADSVCVIVCRDAAKLAIGEMYEFEEDRTFS